MKSKTLFLLISILTLTSSVSRADDNVAPANLRLYDFEYVLIPVFADQLRPGDLYESVFLDLDTMFDKIIPEMNLKPDFERDGIKAEPFLQGNYRGVVYTFPEPSEMPQAKYGVVVFVSQKENRYFTLEKSMDFEGYFSEAWVLGEKSNGSHVNYGNCAACDTPKDFIDIIERRGLLGPQNKDKE